MSSHLIQILLYQDLYMPGSCYRSRTQGTRHDRFRGTHVVTQIQEIGEFKSHSLSCGY